MIPLVRIQEEYKSCKIVCSIPLNGWLTDIERGKWLSKWCMCLCTWLSLLLSHNTQYLLMVTFETNDNYSIQFEISNNSSTIWFNSIRNEKNTICTALSFIWVFDKHLLTPRLLGVYYFLSLTLSVCLFVCNASSKIDSSSLFLDGIEPFLDHQLSMTKTTKRCSSNFYLLPWQRNMGYFCKKFKLLLLFCFPMESSHFLAVSSPWPPLQNVVLRFLI